MGSTTVKRNRKGSDGMRRNLLRNADFHTLNSITDSTGNQLFRTNGPEDCKSILKLAYGGSDGGQVVIPSTGSAYQYVGFFFTAPVEAGKTYTVSVMAKGSASNVAIFELIASKGGANSAGRLSSVLHKVEISSITSEWKKYQFTVTIPTTSDETKFLEVNFWMSGEGNLYICQPKLEEGNTATDFCLNEEDLRGRGITDSDVMFTASKDTPAWNNGTDWVTDDDGLITAANADKGYSLWQCTKVTYTDGDIDGIGIMKIGLISDLADVTELYCNDTSTPSKPTSHDALGNWKTRDEFNAVKGQYVYTCSEILWRDGTYTYTAVTLSGYTPLNGNDAEFYELTATPAMFHVDKTGKWDNDVTIKKWHIKGDTRESVDANLNISDGSGFTKDVQTEEDGVTLQKSNDTYEVTQSVETEKEIIIKDTEGDAPNLVIPVVRDAVSIKTADVVFCSHTSDTEAPADSVFSSAYTVNNKTTDATYVKYLTPVSGEYLWQCTKVTYTDGTTAYTGKQCLGKWDDLQSGYEMYHLSTSGTTKPDVPPTSNDWDPDFTPSNGMYLWECTKIVWKDGDPTYTTPTCIGYFGTNGSYYVYEFARSKSRTDYSSNSIDTSIGTSGWQKDKAPDASTDYPYIWQRSKLYNPNTNTYGEEWSYICLTGPDGEDSVVIDLDNEMDTLPVNYDGIVEDDVEIITHARLYKGAEPVSSEVSVSVDTMKDSNAGDIDANSPTYKDGEAEIVWDFQTGQTFNDSRLTTKIKLTYNDKTYTALFTLNILRPGAPGESPTVYQVKPSPNALSFTRLANTDTLTPSNQTLKCGYTKSKDKTTTSVENQSSGVIDSKYYIYFRYQYGGGTWQSWEWYTKDYITVASGTGYTAYEFCISTASSASEVSDTNILDRETVPIVKTGARGNSEQVTGYKVEYAISNDGTTPPSSGWQSDPLEATDANPFLWTRVTTHYKYGDDTISYSVSKKGTGITGVDTRYILYDTADPTQPSDSEFDAASDTFPTDVSLGDTVWSRTTTTYSDGTTSKVYACNRIGDDGDAGGSVHIAYATAVTNIGSNGYVSSSSYVTGFSTTYVSGAEYIGIWVDPATADSTDPTKYQWSKIKGEQGPRGYEGPGEYNIFKLSVFRNDNMSAPSGATNGGKGTWCDEPQDVSEDWPYEYVSTRKKTNGVWGSYSKPSLYANNSVNANPNLLDQTDFASEYSLDKWDKRSQTFSGNDDSYTDSSGNKLSHVQRGGKNGHNYYGDQNTDCGTSGSFSKEVLEQILLDGDTEKIQPDTWYTLSFWERCGSYTKFLNETSKLYGFAEQKLYLIAGHKYTLLIGGYVSSTAQTKSKSLVLMLKNSSGTVIATSEAITATTLTEKWITATAPADGYYTLAAYLYPNDTDRSTVDYGTATLSYVRLADTTGQAMVYIYPSAIVTSQVFFDGVEYTTYSGNLGTWLQGTLSNGEGDWRQHVITFKTQSSLDSSTTRYILFRLMPSPMEGQKAFLHICQPKLERGKIATSYGRSENDQVTSATHVRRTEWSLTNPDGTAIHYNDSTEVEEDGVKYLDIVTVTGKNSYKLFMCKKAHDSSTSTKPNYSISGSGVVSSLGDTQYWTAFHDIGKPLRTPLVDADTIIASYLQGGDAVFSGTVKAVNFFQSVLNVYPEAYYKDSTSGEERGVTGLTQDVPGSDTWDSHNGHWTMDLTDKTPDVVILTGNFGYHWPATHNSATVAMAHNVNVKLPDASLEKYHGKQIRVIDASWVVGPDGTSYKPQVWIENANSDPIAMLRLNLPTKGNPLTMSSYSYQFPMFNSNMSGYRRVDLLSVPYEVAKNCLDSATEGKWYWLMVDFDYFEQSKDMSFGTFLYNDYNNV